MDIDGIANASDGLDKRIGSLWLIEFRAMVIFRIGGNEMKQRIEAG